MKTIDWQKQPLIPVIIQDALTQQVLMLGYMNEDAFKQTIDSKSVTFFSRSKKRLWQKGETSGNILRLESYDIDCDMDAILIQAIPEGPTCHTGSQSCFNNLPKPVAAISLLESVIKDRKKAMPKNSYTSQLLSEGSSAITKKIVEEAAEVMMASQKESTQRLSEELTDLFYHMLVLMSSHGISLDDFTDEIRRRLR